MPKIVVLNMPPEWYFGIDFRIWQIGEKFRGICNVPHGVHFIYYSTPCEAWRQGFFHYFTSDSDILVKQWDPNSESLIDLSHDTAMRVAEATRSDVALVAGLAPFEKCIDSDTQQDWLSATCFVTPKVVDRIRPVNGSPFRSAPQEAETLEDSSEGKLFWTPISKFRAPVDATPCDISRFHMDRTAYLKQIVSEAFEEDHTWLLGEVQAAFLLFLLGQNYTAFAQWKTFIEILLACREEGISENLSLFEDFLYVVKFQLKQIPEDLLTDAIVSDDDSNKRPIFLIPLMAQFFSACKDCLVPRESIILSRVGELETLLASQFGPDWTSVLQDEDGPTVVDL